MTCFETLSIILLFFTALIGLIQLGKINKTNKKSHDWNRRLASQELMYSLSTGEFPKSVETVREYSKTFNIPLGSNYIQVLDDIQEEDKEMFKRKIRLVINFLEGLAISIKNNITDEEIIYDFASVIVTEWYKWSEKFIEEERNKSNPPEQSLYIDFEDLAKKWSKKLDEEKANIKKGLTSDGKDKL